MSLKIVVLAVFSLLLQITTQESIACECCDVKFVCGKRMIHNPDRHNLGTSGMADPGQWPWYSVIEVRTSNLGKFEFKCGATLISPKHVITSRLCVIDEKSRSVLDVDKFLIRVGTHKLNMFNFGNARHRKVSKVHQPVDYDKSSGNQIAILEMSANVTFNDYVQPICINEHIIAYYQTVLGWGALEDRTRLETVIDSDYYCYDREYSKLYKKLCAKDRGSIALIYDENVMVWYLQGIIICDGSPCKSGIKDGTVPIAKYLPFIVNVTNLAYLQKIRKGQRFDASKKYPKLLLERNCGHNLASNIEYDLNAQLYEFPWIAQLIKFDVHFKEWHMKCVGSLVSFRYVLTSAFCVNLLPTRVRLGNYNRFQDPDCNLGDKTYCHIPVRDYEIDYATIHPDYNHPKILHKNNIALVRTSKNVLFEDHINPICLPVSLDLRRMKPPAEYVVASWDYDQILRKKLTAQTESGSAEFCSELFNIPKDELFWSTDLNFEFMEAAPVGQYVHSNGMRFVQFGLTVEVDIVCNYTLNTNVSYFMDWIIANMQE